MLLVSFFVPAPRFPSLQSRSSSVLFHVSCTPSHQPLCQSNLRSVHYIQPDRRAVRVLVGGADMAPCRRRRQEAGLEGSEAEGSASRGEWQGGWALGDDCACWAGAPCDVGLAGAGTEGLQAPAAQARGPPVTAGRAHIRPAPRLARSAAARPRPPTPSTACFILLRGSSRCGGEGAWCG